MTILDNCSSVETLCLLGSPRDHHGNRTHVLQAYGYRALYLLPLRSTLRRLTDMNGNEMEKDFGSLIVIIEGSIMELVSTADAPYRRTGHFVVDSTDYATFLGLVATPACLNARCGWVTMDDSKISAISLI